MKCMNCCIMSKDGIIKQSQFFCSKDCYDKKQQALSVPKHVHFVTSTSPGIIKKCNYCFDDYDININNGISYGPMWFCCQHHLTLANPRPKAVPMQGGLIMHGGPIFMGQGGPFSPFFG